MKHLLRLLPPVHELQKDARFSRLMAENGIDFINMTNYLKQVLETVRELMLADSWEGSDPGTEVFTKKLFQLLQLSVEQQFRYTLKRVINGTGTILHTNLGRARLSDRAARHVVETAQYYSNLEFNLEEGERGSRHSHVEALVMELTGAEAAMVVNNNAAAVYLVLRSLARGKEVIVSRGQLVEIGGSFRISSIMEESGAKLVEVGTTNKTHLNDYENAINEETAMILKVHTSNFKTIGFTKSVCTQDLALLSQRHGNLIFYEDLGSGVLYDFRKNGIGDEPVIKDVVKMGADLVSFSGDKLLGGPQAGIIAGKKEWISRLKKHQLARVVRVDKMTLAALEGTLIDYLKGEKGMKEIPAVRDLLASKEEIYSRTAGFLDRIHLETEAYETKIADGTSQAGGGTMPDVELPTSLAVLKHKSLSAEQLARKLRTGYDPSIIVRIQKDEVIIDLRTVTAEEEQSIIEALKKISLEAD